MFALAPKSTPSMLSRAAAAALRDIAHHIDLAARFAAGFDRQSFEADPTHGLRRHPLPGDHFRSVPPPAGRPQGAAPFDCMEGYGWSGQHLSP
jgi:hypothetical protein